MQFQQGLSGLYASSKELDVIGNNIANANTYGAKASRAEFADMYANSIGLANNAGIGVRVAAVAQQFAQGNISSTNNTLDVAINGTGFFQVTTVTGELAYSRNGQFKLDKEGYLVNTDGQRIQGYRADKVKGIVTGVRTDLQLNLEGMDPKSTTAVNMALNLDARGKVTDPGPTATDPINFEDAQTYNNATTVRLYDAKGEPADVSFFYQKTANDTWNIYPTVGNTRLQDGSGSDLVMKVKFEIDPTDGVQRAYDVSGATPTLMTAFEVNIPQTTSNDAINNVKIDMSGATQFGAAFNVSKISQDGRAPGSFTDLTIGQDGLITARFTNGLTQPAGQLELAQFRNPQGLQPAGNNLWVGSAAAGDPVAGVPGSGTLGVLQSSALEESNVDMTSELVRMITAQRLYQANAQTIKTQDSVMQTLVSLR